MTHRLRRLAVGNSFLPWVCSATISSLLLINGSTAEPNKAKTGDTADGAFARMSMTLAKSLLFVRVDVVDLEVRFGLETASQLEAAAGGRDLTPPLLHSIARIATQSQDASIHLRFLRDIDLDRFISGARKNTKLVYKAGIIKKETYHEIAERLPFWYSFLRTRGIKTDDLMIYRIQGDSLRTIYRGSDGKVYLDLQGQGQERCLAVLGSYFVPGSEFRDSLIRSLFDWPSSRPSSERPPAP